MARTANLNIRIDPKTKAEAELLFASFGITISEAVNIFLHQSLLEKGIPFALKQPRYNEETEAAINEAKAIINKEIQVKEYATSRNLFSELDETEK